MECEHERTGLFSGGGEVGNALYIGTWKMKVENFIFYLFYNSVLGL